MNRRRRIFAGGAIFDGSTLHRNHALVMSDGCVAAIVPEETVDRADAEIVRLDGDVLCPGYVDLQVNGGDGIMFNDDPSVETVRRIAHAHRHLGATTIFPTLITDTPAHGTAAIASVEQAIEAGVPGIGGLHLEGPHLSVARKGAHDGALIRPMEDADVAELIDAVNRLPALMVTLAPETVAIEHVEALSQAGAIVSLGHTDADFDTISDYAAAGASCVTHLFNAMRQMGNRAPGVVGAALGIGRLSAGLIADGIHVHPTVIGIALAAKTGPGEIFLVSDAMSPAGTDRTSFLLNGREIQRRNGRLTLADGTLAGADLDLTTALGVLVGPVGLPLDRALAMATSIPARVGRQGAAVGAMTLGAASPMVRLSFENGGAKLVEVFPAER